ncbi:hypothetical protein [Ilumatobacter nonamiensis]|uniref:hypothetical protein n=1 Tax=Ilumatobacter nonamiensis TaxID=467093 RepID=UPI00034A3DB9|nr:hypothetical protein [Ilumatobacter nonamiensis]
MADGDRNELIVEFAGNEGTLLPGDELTFGRSGDLVIDANNPYLHRSLGVFAHVSGAWWVANTGSTIAIRLDDANSSSYGIVAPGARSPLAYETTALSFEAGESSYSLRCEILHDRPSFELTRPQDWAGPDDEATRTATSLPLNDDQRLLLIALCEPWLDADGVGELATNRQLASRLGWTITKFNRKLDWLCSKFAKAGVSGLVGTEDLLARDRRLRLVEHTLHAGLVDRDDLSLLDQPTPDPSTPRPD